LVNRPDRVQIWAGQLAANDFPPICAMTGQPAQTWRKFRFATVPGWAYVLLVLICTGVGLLPIFIIWAIASRKASGHLPLTLASRRKLKLVNWFVIGLLPLMVVLFIAAAIVGSSSSSDTTSTISFVLIVLAFLAFVAFVIGRLVMWPLVRPRGYVKEQQPGQYDKLVELRNVNPAFVAAVLAARAQRAAQQGVAPEQPNLPQIPESN
jgi:hypothetical protein